MFITTCQALLQESSPNTALTYVRGHGRLHAGMFAYFLSLLECKVGLRSSCVFSVSHGRHEKSDYEGDVKVRRCEGVR